jgi:hypothetical protein
MKYNEACKTANTGFGKLVYSEEHHASPPLLIHKHCDL